LENEAIAEMEIKPLFVYTDRAVAADARAYIRLAREAAGS
jgi:hypothetical protein